MTGLYLYDWQADCCRMQRASGGTWKGSVLLAPGRYEYRFIVDGQWRDDPNCVQRVPNAFGGSNCVVEVAY